MRRILLLMVLIFSSVMCYSQTTNYQVYALYVVNFAKYSSWPNLNGQLDIVVFGKTKVYDELLKQNGKVVNGHTIKVRTVDDLAGIEIPHILYVADNRSSTLEEINKTTTGKPVLIIGEREGLVKKGAGFSFVILDNGTLRFDMNSSELEKRSIKVSKNLSTLAHSTL